MTHENWIKDEVFRDRLGVPRRKCRNKGKVSREIVDAAEKELASGADKEAVITMIMDAAGCHRRTAQKIVRERLDAAGQVATKAPPKDEQYAVLRSMRKEGKTAQEIADVLGITAGTVRRRARELGFTLERRQAW